MKRKCCFNIVVAVLMMKLLSGCGNVESEEKEYSDAIEGQLKVSVKYNLETYRSLLEKTDDLWGLETWEEDEWLEDEWEQEGELTSTDHLLSQVESEEGWQAINGILEEEGSQLVHLAAGGLEDLNYCLFETSVGKGMEFHLLLRGNWEGKEVRQHQIFSLNEEDSFPLGQLSELCGVSKEDMDFDGRPDLLIYEGSSYGAKNSFNHYRVMRWDEAQGQFVYYPSFPFWATRLNLEDKQVFYKGKGAASDRYVRIYEVVEGEYRVVRELDISTQYVPREDEGIIYTHAQEILSYYENGEMVWEYDVTGMDWDEMEELCREKDLEGLSEVYSYARDYG